MELTLNHESICINEVVYDGVLEQPVELDYMLPDYNQGIFKVLKCRLTPKIASKRVSGDKLILDGMVYIKVIYIAEETNQIRSIEQKMPFSKTADLKEAAQNPRISINLRTDYVNCRVVNPRRLDIRGAVSCKMSVTELKTEQLLTDAKGMGTQLQKRKFSTGLDLKTTDKQFTIHEEFDIPAGASIDSILNCVAAATAGEHRVIANKVVVKGEISLRILYALADDENPLKLMEQSVPVSQIVDLQGVDDEYGCAIKFDVISVELEPKHDTDGNANMIAASISLIVGCEAYKNKEIQVVTDMYSTGYESTLSVKNINTQKMLGVIRENSSIKQMLELGEQVIDVYEVHCNIKNINVAYAAETFTVTGEMEVNALCCDNDHIPCNIDRTVPIEIKLSHNFTDEGINFNCGIVIIAIEYTLAGTDKIEVRCQAVVSGEVFCGNKTDVVMGINIDEQKPKAKDNSALTIYYADEGERVWDIAKRYNTSINAIINENTLESEKLKQRDMLLIPRV